MNEWLNIMLEEIDRKKKEIEEIRRDVERRKNKRSSATGNKTAKKKSTRSNA